MLKLTVCIDQYSVELTIKTGYQELWEQKVMVFLSCVGLQYILVQKS